MTYYFTVSIRRNNNVNIGLSSSFSVSIIKDPVFRTGWDVQLTFQIKLHLRDLALLMDIQAHLNGIGTIRKGKDYCVFKVK